MNIFIICSKFFYPQVNEVKSYLEQNGHAITLPNCFEHPTAEAEAKAIGAEEHAQFKSEKIKHSKEVIKNMDAVLVLNYTKNGICGYIGGATFLEMYDAFSFDKQIYLLNPVVESILSDEIVGFRPIILNGCLDIFRASTAETTPYAFLGVCDTFRKRPQGEAIWQEMMENMQEVSEVEFITHCNVSEILDPDESWLEYKQEAEKQCAPIKFYKSNRLYFFQTAGFEFIWGQNAIYK